MTNPAVDLQLRLLAESRINLGMVTTLESANIPNGALQLVQNADVRYDQVTRRAGSDLFSPGAPDANPVMRVIFFKDQVNNTYIIRVTTATAHLLAGGVWQAFTIAAGLHGTASDYMDAVDVLNTLVLSNNGADPLQKVDPVAKTIAQLGDAPAYRYVTGFFNRAVGAALRGINEVQIGWSGDGDVTEWNSATDQTAGNAPLLDSPSDLADYITGLWAFSNVIIVPREKSIWIGQKQPIPTNPFYFYNALPGLGSDSPYSQQITKDSLIWFDSHTSSVWEWIPGQPVAARIGENIENQLVANVSDPKLCFASYSTKWDEYTLFVPSVGSSTIQAWKFNRRTRAWTYNEYTIISCVDDLDLSLSTTRIMDLVGPISGLSGTIATLSTPGAATITRLYGQNNGNITIEDLNTDTDAPSVTSFTTTLVSKAFKLPVTDQYVGKVVIEYQCLRNGTLILEYSKTGGKLNDWITAKTVTPTVLNEPLLLTLRRMIKCRRFAWRLRVTAGAFDLLSYEVHTFPSGEARGG